MIQSNTSDLKSEFRSFVEKTFDSSKKTARSLFLADVTNTDKKISATLQSTLQNTSGSILVHCKQKKKKIRVKINSSLKIGKKKISLGKKSRKALEVYFTTIVKKPNKQKKKTASKPSQVNGFGIANGGNSCYLNASLQAIRLAGYCSPQNAQHTDYVTTHFLKNPSRDSKQPIRDAYIYLVATGHSKDSALEFILENSSPNFLKTHLNEVCSVAENDVHIEGYTPVIQEDIKRIQLFIQTKNKAKTALEKTLKILEKKTVQKKTINKLRNLCIECGMEAQERSVADANNACLKILEILSIKPTYIHRQDELATNGYLVENTPIISIPCRGTIQQTMQDRYAIENTPPQILPVMLKRFSYNIESNKSLKISDKIPINDQLQIRVGNLASDRFAQYELASVIVHQGETLDSGHYYTYARNNKGHYIQYNDSAVHPDPNAAEDIVKNGYIFFYRLKSK